MVQKSKANDVPSSAITRLPDGSICINGECFRPVIKPNGDIAIDASNCPDEIKELIVKSCVAGKGLQWNINKNSQ